LEEGYEEGGKDRRQGWGRVGMNGKTTFFLCALVDLGRKDIREIICWAQMYILSQPFIP
jgi:hypothetical protein